MPLALLWYVGLKLVGTRYLVTNRAVKRMASLGIRQLEEVPLSQIGQAIVDPDSS